MEIHNKIKPTHHFETKEVVEYKDVGAKLKLSIAIPPPEKRNHLDEVLLMNMVQKCIRRLKQDFHDFVAKGYKLED